MLSRLNKIGWYWHRLHAMDPREVALRLQKKAHQRSDRKYVPPQNFLLDPNARFPKLPNKAAAPRELLAALEKDTREILRGEWKAFGHLPIQLNDPPQWQADNLIGRDLQSGRIGFALDHRAQPHGADIKVIWDPNRWYQLVRLAMAAWLLNDNRAQEKCVEWLYHWVKTNPPFTGLNWTSGLETGLRLVQYTWIDAFLAAAGAPAKTLHELRLGILPPHVHYTWRYKSFGSSANNHLIGELVGVILAQARWPELAKLSAPLSQIGVSLEREVLAQFAEDGGNKEQALGYHLFSWEFCFQAQYALAAASTPLSQVAQERLLAAGRFYRRIKAEIDPWDFGDSDNAWVTPLFASETKAAQEWWRWFAGRNPVLSYWWGEFIPTESDEGKWEIFAHSGYAIFRTADWLVRFDFSPLGYLSMAPHGHLDALHVSVSFRGQPIVIDPGTGAYYADKSVRNYLASWAAHNGPHLKEPPAEFPKRFGTFLWSEHHSRPRFHVTNPYSISAEIDHPYGKAERTVCFLPERNAIRIQDRFNRGGATRAPIITRWKFAPELTLIRTSPNEFRAGPVTFTAPSWKMARTYNPPEELHGKTSPTLAPLGNVPIDSIVSPAFRALASAPYLALESDGDRLLELLISPG